MMWRHVRGVCVGGGILGRAFKSVPRWVGWVTGILLVSLCPRQMCADAGGTEEQFRG